MKELHPADEQQIIRRGKGGGDHGTPGARVAEGGIVAALDIAG